MPDSGKPVVSALIVNRNSKDDLLRCLKTFFASADVPVEAIVVDNDSSDGSPAAVTDDFPQATVLVQSKNLGYGRAANVGLETVGLSRLFPKSSRFGRYNMGHLPDNEVHEMDAGTAACLMLRRSTLDRVGFFDPRYYMFGEDLDLCYRLKLGGWKIFFVPTARASRSVKPVSGDRERQISYERHRAMWTYHFKHHSEDTSAFGNGLVWAQIWGRYAADRVGSLFRGQGRQAT